MPYKEYIIYKLTKSYYWDSSIEEYEFRDSGFLWNFLLSAPTLGTIIILNQARDLSP